MALFTPPQRLWLFVALLAAVLPPSTLSFIPASPIIHVHVVAAPALAVSKHQRHYSAIREGSSSRVIGSRRPSSSLSSNSLLHADNVANDEAAAAATAAADVARFTASYGEASRKYRRTIYRHEDWLHHRSDDRLGENLRGILFSGIVRQLQAEVTIELAFATAIVLWNQVGATHFLLPEICLPTLPFTLSSPALGLLLVFRTNASYARWMEARNRWGTIISQSRNMVRMACTFVDRTTNNDDDDDDDDDDSSDKMAKMEHLARHVWLLSRSIMNTLSGPEDEVDYEKDLNDVFPDDTHLVSQMLGAPDRASAALMDASLTLDSLPIDEKRRVEIDKSIVIMGECLSVCERIYQQPVPLVYTRHTARFLSLWLLLLPLGLYSTLGWIVVPSVGFLSLFLFGIEELAIQLEEPFSILPMQDYCNIIRQSTSGMVQWASESAGQTMVPEVLEEVNDITGY